MLAPARSLRIAADRRGRPARTGDQAPKENTVRTRSLIAGLLIATGAAVGFARPPAEILAELEAVEYPAYDRERASDPEYRNEYQRLLRETIQHKAALMLELYEEAPDHEKVDELLPKRWQLLQQWGEPEMAPLLLEETEGVAQQPLASSELRKDAVYWNAIFTCSTAEYDLDKSMVAIERFIEVAPEDDRAVRLLLSAAQRLDDSDTQIKLYRRSLALFPDSEYNKYTGGKIKQVDAIGKPFELTFTDAVTGNEISLQRDLRGKVVVIDFWATWCGPCIADMPHMKVLYDAFSGQGVEFIGVSLDQPEDKGGLEKLLAYVKENEIRWPQYYQGAYWDGEFSRSWGINSIPALFVVDTQGRLHSVNGRGKLEDMIPALLSQRGSG